MNSLKFEGKGFEFFKIHFINVIVTLLSATLLYPWAMVREIKYFCRNLSLAGQPFEFTGTARTFFNYYIKTFLVLLCIYLICFGGGFLLGKYQYSMVSIPIYFATISLYIILIYYFLPIVLHGSINYRFDHLNWKEIKPSYSGKLSELVPIYFIGMLLTTLTGGIYHAWFRVKLARYVLQNIHFGDLRFDFSGDSTKLFFLILKGTLLSFITLGIYGIWYAKELYEYSVNNIIVRKGDQEFHLQSDANTLEVFEMTVGNFLLVVLTLGIGGSWAYMRYYQFIINHCVVPVDFDFSIIGESEEHERIEKPATHWLDKWNPKWIA